MEIPHEVAERAREILLAFDVNEDHAITPSELRQIDSPKLEKRLLNDTKALNLHLQETAVEAKAGPLSCRSVFVNR